MGPTNIALVKLFQADQALRESQERLDAATKNVRIQDRRTNDAVTKLAAAKATYKELQARSGNLDLDMRSRDVHIEKLRTQQQSAKNNKEYQTFLVEINTQKVDRAKIEEQAMKVLEELETATTVLADATTTVELERTKLSDLKRHMGDTVSNLETEIEALRVPRDEVAASLPGKARTAFERLADHHDGEAMSSLMKPDKRKEEYVCSACMMDLVTDVYNKLHTRDDMVFCPSCRRILYIPADLPPELAVNKKKSSAASAPTPAEEDVTPRMKESRAKGKMGDLLRAAQGESVKNALDADQKPLEFTVTVDGVVAGVYKGKSAENLQRIINYRLEEQQLSQQVTLMLITDDEHEVSVTEQSSAG